LLHLFLVQIAGLNRQHAHSSPLGK
jgi:hypothetical protein